MCCVKRSKRRQLQRRHCKSATGNQHVIQITHIQLAGMQKGVNAVNTPAGIDRNSLYRETTFGFNCTFKRKCTHPKFSSSITIQSI